MDKTEHYLLPWMKNDQIYEIDMLIFFSVLVPLMDGTSSCPWSSEPLESYQVTHRTATSTGCGGNQASVFDLQRNTFKMRLCENTNNKASRIIFCVLFEIRTA